MFRYSGLKVFLLLVILFAFNQAVYATSCEDKSPNFIKLGDDYFNMDNQGAVSDKNKQVISVFYDKIQGDWTGSRVFTECVDNNPDNDYVLSKGFKNASTDVAISVDSSGIVNMQATLFYDGTTTMNQLTLFSGVITEAKLSNVNTLDYVETYRQIRAKSGGVKHRDPSIFRESIGQLQIKDKSFVIKISNYVNGYFLSEESWALHPGKQRR